MFSYFIRDPNTKELVEVTSYEDFRDLEFFELLQKYKRKKGTIPATLEKYN